MIRQITATGTLARDPEPKKIGEREVAAGRLAVSQGRDRPTIWLDLTCWSGYAGKDLLTMRKGDRVTVCGRLTLREWTSREGEARQGLGVDVDSIEGPRRDPGEFRDRVTAAAEEVATEINTDDLPF